MLKVLEIENIAVIEKAAVQFDTGLNVLTGETGAGKSIVVDAINAILGERTSRELVRHGAPQAVVRAFFEGVDPAVQAVIGNLGLEPETVRWCFTDEFLPRAKAAARSTVRPVL